MPYVALIFTVGTTGGSEGGGGGKVEAASFGDGDGGRAGGIVVSPANAVRGDGGGGGEATTTAADDDDGSGAGRASVVALSTGAGAAIATGELTAGTIAASAPGAVGMGAAREVGTWSWPSESWWIICAVVMVGRRVVVRKKVRKKGRRREGVGGRILGSLGFDRLREGRAMGRRVRGRGLWFVVCGGRWVLGAGDELPRGGG